jgi:hypothetical protein
MPADDGEKELVSWRSCRLQLDPVRKSPKVISELVPSSILYEHDICKKKGRTCGMPVGCIPEKIIRSDSDFVETFRDEGCPSLYAVHALLARPVLSKRWRGVKNLSGKWTRRICDGLK